MSGRGPRAVCDQCATETQLLKLRKRFDGHMVCQDCWEPRHPQERLPKPPVERPVKNPRPEPPYSEIDACTTLGRTSFAGHAVAGCMVAGMGGTYFFEGIPPPTFGWICSASGSTGIVGQAVVNCAVVG